MSATVLVVEDEVKLRDVVRAYLEREGLEVLSTGSSAEGIALALMVTRTWLSSISVFRIYLARR
jgi:DNA-binding response OmpR family regulator